MNSLQQISREMEQLSIEMLALAQAQSIIPGFDLRPNFMPAGKCDYNGNHEFYIYDSADSDEAVEVFFSRMRLLYGDPVSLQYVASHTSHYCTYDHLRRDAHDEWWSKARECGTRWIDINMHPAAGSGTMLPNYLAVQFHEYYRYPQTIVYDGRENITYIHAKIDIPAKNWTNKIEVLSWVGINTRYEVNADGYDGVWYAGEMRCFHDEPLDGFVDLNQGDTVKMLRRTYNSHGAALIKGNLAQVSDVTSHYYALREFGPFATNRVWTIPLSKSASYVEKVGKR